MQRIFRCAVIAIVFCVAACGPARSGATGTITGTISYDGAAAGGGRPLGIAVYKTYPPRGIPVAYRLVEEYQFPYHYSFDVPPGTYYVGALIDVDPTDTRYSGMLNAKRDPHGYAGNGQKVEVEDLHGAASVDILLEDVR